MKVKDWIKELQSLNPEKELYVHYRGSDGEDWGYMIARPRLETIPLEKRVFMKRTLIYRDEGHKKATPLGECATMEIDWI